MSTSDKVTSSNPDSKCDFKEIFQIIELADAQIANLADLLKNMRNAGKQRSEMVLQLLDSITNTLISAAAFLLPDFRPPNDQQPALRSLVEFMPQFVTNTWICLNDQNILKFAMSDGIEREFVNKLVVSRTSMLQSSIHFVTQFYNSQLASSEMRFKLAYDNITKCEFLIRLDDAIKLETEFEAFIAQKVCTEIQRMAMRRALQYAYEARRRQIKDTLAKQRVLQFLGHPKEKMIADHLQELVELIPDLSRQQLHLCLRHFGYDAEKTLEALLEREKLPLDLKILLRINDTFEDVSQYDRKLLPDYSDECLDNNTENGSGGENSLPIAQRNSSLDLERLRQAISALAESENVVEIGGKLLVKQDCQRSEPTEEERSALLIASVRRANQMDEESAAEDEEESGREDKMENRDARLAGEVGESGRFNRPKFLDPYEDEYDDTFEHAQEYSEVDTGATTFDEKESLENTRWREIRHAGDLPKHTSGQPSSAKVPNPQRKASPKPASAKPSQPGKGNQQKEKKESSTAAARKSAPATSTKANENYTGGRERQLKERNKGKERQRGADKKARTANFL